MFGLFKNQKKTIPTRPNYEMARKVWLEFNTFNLINFENELHMYLICIPRSLLPYPKNYIWCAFYIFLDGIRKGEYPDIGGDVQEKLYAAVIEIGGWLFAGYPDYENYKINLKYKRKLDKLFPNMKETFKKLYGVYEISEKSYNNSPSAIDSTNEKLIHDFGISPDWKDIYIVLLKKNTY